MSNATTKHPFEFQECRREQQRKDTLINALEAFTPGEHQQGIDEALKHIAAKRKRQEFKQIVDRRNGTGSRQRAEQGLSASAVVVAVGAMIAQGGIKVWPVWIAGALAAALGDWLGPTVAISGRFPPPQSPSARRTLRCQLGAARHFHPTVFRPSARGGTPRGRPLRNAIWRFQIANLLPSSYG
jgi:hypothetical protein